MSICKTYFGSILFLNDVMSRDSYFKFCICLLRGLKKLTLVSNLAFYLSPIYLPHCVKSASPGTYFIWYGMSEILLVGQISHIRYICWICQHFLWDMNNTKWYNGFYIQFRQSFAKETFSYDEYLKS